MPKLRDLTGQKFGKLLVIKRADNRVYNNGKERVCWQCLCDCGNTKIVSRDDLVSGFVKSCGCFRKEKTKETKTKHGLRKSKLYRIWSNIKSRCYNSQIDIFKYYGAKGIIMCDKWLNDFKEFHDWSMLNGYKENLTIDRINPKGNYEPSNCRWITPKEQQNNKLNNHIITYKSQTHTLAEWSEILGIDYKVLHRRIKYLNWDIDKAFTTKVRHIAKRKDEQDEIK